MVKEGSRDTGNQLANGNRSGKASESLGMSYVPEKGPFPVLQGVGGGEDCCQMLGVQVPPGTHIHVCVQQGESYSEPKTSLDGSAEPAEVRSQAASFCTEAHLPSSSS